MSVPFPIVEKEESLAGLELPGKLRAKKKGERQVRLFDIYSMMRSRHGFYFTFEIVPSIF